MFTRKKIFIIILLFSQFISAQKIIRGVVQDEETQQPIIGVNILLLGSETGTVSDVKGSFELTIPDDTSPVLRLSHIGYNTSEVTIDSSFSGILILSLIHI